MVVVPSARDRNRTGANFTLNFRKQVIESSDTEAFRVHTSFLPSLQHLLIDTMELLDTRSLLVSLVAAGLAIVLVLVQKQSLRNADRSRIAVKAARGTSTILLVGPMGSGKTSFFGRVRQLPARRHSWLQAEGSQIYGYCS